MLKKEFLGAFAKLQIKPLLASLGLFVRLSICMEEFGFHWTSFHEIWYLSTFRQSIEKIQASLKFEKNNGYFT